MNLVAMVIGYTFMVVGGTVALLYAGAWTADKLPRINRRVIYIMRLGMKAYNDLPKDQRRY